MLLLVYVAVAVAVGAWLSAVVACLRLLPQRQDEISGWEMAFNGMKWLSRETFKPAAAGLHRVFVSSVITFFAAILAIILFVLLTQV